MRKIQNEISQRLKKVNFNGIFPDFHPFRFALYDNERVYFADSIIPKDDRFIGNTAIQYNQEWIAIWNIAEPNCDLDFLTACIVHEMFHAYQNEIHEKRFPNEMRGCFYPRNLENFNQKYRENLLLAALIHKFDKVVWQNFINLRKKRLKFYPLDVDYEIKVEIIEGMAVYVELEALKMINPLHYKSKLNSCISNLENPDLIFDIRRISYDTGSIIQSIIRNNQLDQIDWSKGTEVPSSEIPSVTVDLTDSFEKYYDKIDKGINNALLQAEKMKISGMTLLGFDPYNVRSSGQYLYHPHFIKYGPNEQDGHFLMGTYITKMKAHTRIIEEAYRVVSE
jgi:hypothetical protein